ncbi:hypothetical protein [Mesotoga sp.]|uniref:hypothetical protein n=1 Tax=Mesotoga sp. TaxID=2053577 RepID=UPI00345E8B4B
MRKLTFLLVILSIIIVISSCMVPKTEVERLVPPEDAPEEVIFAVQSSSGVYSSDLIVGSDIVVGRIDYWVDDDNKLLYIEFHATEEEWMLTETRVATSLSVTTLPRNPETLKLDSDYFPNVNTHNPPSNYSSYVISLDFVSEGTTKIYFSAYAEALRNENKYFSQIGITAPCIYFAVIYVEPVVELRPLLKVAVEGEVDLSRITTYDWELTKDASPEAINNLARGESATVEYILTAKRLLPQNADTFSVTGVATVTNEGSLQADQVGLTLSIQGKNGGDWVEIDYKTLIETASNTTISASDLIGIGKPFAIEFDPGSFSSIRILAEATDNWPELVDDYVDQVIPSSPSSWKLIDESASVIDMPRNLVEFENAGFSVNHTGTWPWTVSPWVLTDVNGGSKEYSIVITNVAAPAGNYTLTNDATLTENDTSQKREDFARVLVTTPEPQEDILTLEATVTGSFRWGREIEYDWEVEKSVAPETIYLDIKEDEDVTYSVNATRKLTDNSTDTFFYEGEAEVGNSLTSNLTVDASLTISLLESSDGGTFSAVATDTHLISNFAPGDVVTKTFDFSSYAFKNGYYYRVKAEVLSGAVSKTNTGALAGPISPTSLIEFDKTATVNDEYKVPVGFDVTPDSDYVWPWLLSETPAATTYTFNILNKEKESGEYKVPNTVTLVEDDTKQERSDDATVTIIVLQSSISTVVTSNLSSLKWEREVDYIWDIEKDVNPKLITLPTGDATDLDYWIQVDRSTGSSTDTASLLGKVTVTNASTSTEDATLVSIVVQLQSSADGTVWSDVGSQVSVDFSSNPVLVPGESGIFDYQIPNFKPNQTDYFRVKDVVTTTKTTITSYTNASGPLTPTLVKETDKNASLHDVPVPIEGFTLSNLPTWPLLITEPSTKVEYTITITNDTAGSEGAPYYLYNVATLSRAEEQQAGDVLDWDDATVTILVPAPGLNALVEASVSREDKVEYDWTIDKSASPTVVTLGIGEEAPIDYTIKVTREPWETVDSTYTITVDAKVKNTGPGSALGVKIVLKITEAATEVTLADGITMTEGEEKTFNRTFTTKTYSPSYTAVLTVTSTNDGSPTDSDTADTPSDPNIVEYVDETADLEDLITSVPAGFSIVPSTLDLSWPLTDSATKTFSLTLKNDSALPAGSPYYLTNTATVTEDDTGEKGTDNETVKINVPEDKDLEIDNEHDMEWDQMKEYSWIIDKSVTPQSLTLATGDSGTFNYTLVATRSVEETNIATLTGVATISNTGNTTLTNIVVTIVLKDAVGSTIESYNTIIISLAPGKEQTIPYSFKGFNPGNFVPPFKVVANAVAAGASDTLETTQTVPSPFLTEIDENAYVQDTFVPFSVDGLTLSGNIYREWQVTTASWSKSYSVLVSNTGAAPGKYYLDNTADIFGEDTHTKYDTDKETVTIEVPETVELEAQVEAEFFWDRSKSYSWQLEKEVSPDSVTYDLDEFEKEIDYTITATRTLESDVSEHSYQGAVTVTNNGLSEAKNVKLLIELQYYNGTSWTTIQTLSEVSLGSISAGSNKVHNFGPSAFTPIDVSAEHKVVVIASADAPANNADDFYSSFLGVTSNETTNATATLDDEFTYIPDGFQIVNTDPDPLPFPIELADSSVVQFSITLRKFSFDGSGEITYVMGVDSYISATVSGYMEGTYPGWCIEVNVSGIEGPYTVVDIYGGGAPSTQMAKINYILNTYRDGDYSGADYRHIQLAIWAIMEGSLDWSSWRTMFDPDVPDGDKPIVQAIVDTARDDFLPGCGDVVLISALSSNKQDLLLEAVLSCEVLEFTLENEATLVTETDELWDDAVVEIKLTPTDPEIWDGEETAYGGNYEGDGSAWWYYFDTNGPSTQSIYAGGNLIPGASVTYSEYYDTIKIVLGPNMRLQSVSEPVKISGYSSSDLPSSRPEMGSANIYKGTNLTIYNVPERRYYVIHLDVEVKQ